VRTHADEHQHVRSTHTAQCHHRDSFFLLLAFVFSGSCRRQVATAYAIIIKRMLRDQTPARTPQVGKAVNKRDETKTESNAGRWKPVQIFHARDAPTWPAALQLPCRGLSERFTLPYPQSYAPGGWRAHDSPRNGDGNGPASPESQGEPPEGA
jgi:hypothetical protein